VDDEVLEEAAQGRVHLLREVVSFLGETKRWWLIPIVVCLVGFGVLVSLANTAAAPFIYTLF